MACASGKPKMSAMSNANNLSKRIDELESRLTFQDETIEALNQTITAQWLKIDALARQVEALNERLQEAEANVPGVANEPPPHY
jgi:SlyX protein